MTHRELGEVGGSAHGPGGRSTHDSAEVPALAGVARLFGDLLLTELDAEGIAALRAPEAAEALGALGVALPPGEPTDTYVDALAAEFHAVFLRPERGGAPPVGSLWTEGRFEGELAARVRTLATSAALELEAERVRGAPVDHLGTLLHLWAETAEGRAPWVADELAERHLHWCDAPLRQAAGAAGRFYPGVARAVALLVAELRATRVGR